jgi:putative ABC transport system permease protein
LQLLWRSLIFVSIGLATGTAGAYVATRTMRTLLFQVTPHDLATFLAIPAVLFISALIATYVPARRATKVDPMVTLRYE